MSQKSNDVRALRARELQHRELARFRSNLDQVLSVHSFWCSLRWVNREQAAVIDYLREEKRVLRHRLGAGRLKFTNVERRRPAVKARALCRSVLREIGLSLV